MGARAATGPITTYAAAELRAQRARLEMTYDELAARAGLSKPAVMGALKGRQAIAMENYFALCRALGVDGVRLFAEAVRAEEAAGKAPTPAPEQPCGRPLSMQELKQQRLLGAAMPVDIAADDRPWAGDDADDWEPR